MHKCLSNTCTWVRSKLSTLDAQWHFAEHYNILKFALNMSFRTIDISQRLSKQIIIFQSLIFSKIYFNKYIYIYPKFTLNLGAITPETF